MRPIWKGSIAFGLVNVPIKVYSATEDHDVSLHQVHDKDGGRIKYQRRCEVCGRIVDYEHIDKAYAEGDRTVILSDEDLKTLPAGRSKEIEVVEFVPSDQIDPIMLDRSYFLEPDSRSPKAYALLRRTLEETDRTAIVHFSLRDKTRLGALRVRGDVLMLQSLLWDDEVREANFPSLEDDVRISAKELKMSESLVDSFASDFEPENFSDEYQEQLRKLIDAKLEQGDALDTDATFGEEPEEPQGGEVIDLMDALRRSVAKNRKKPAAASKPARKTAPKKGRASSTKTSAKSSAAKSSGTKSSGSKSSGAKPTRATSTRAKTAKPAARGKAS
ncbi:non-homologous end joining protein Ku [Parafrigoribacterium soli]|uniref:non-homologous end joining protein Ku n=1 Tax=Parafrigoribacterium soli TaxID=3144663 RepID=UPI0032EEBBE7